MSRRSVLTTALGIGTVSTRSGVVAGGDALVCFEVPWRFDPEGVRIARDGAEVMDAVRADVPPGALTSLPGDRDRLMAAWQSQGAER